MSTYNEYEATALKALSASAMEGFPEAMANLHLFWEVSFFGFILRSTSLIKLLISSCARVSAKTRNSSLACT